MKYTDNDLENIIALCEQDENNQNKNLASRCKKALAYTYISLKITKRDKEYLKKFYDPEMDQDALLTLKKIMGM